MCPDHKSIPRLRAARGQNAASGLCHTRSVSASSIYLQAAGLWPLLGFCLRSGTTSHMRQILLATECLFAPQQRPTTTMQWRRQKPNSRRAPACALHKTHTSNSSSKSNKNTHSELSLVSRRGSARGNTHFACFDVHKNTYPTHPPTIHTRFSSLSPIPLPLPILFDSLAPAFAPHEIQALLATLCI